MSGPLEPLWRILREQPDPRHPLDGWREELGDGFTVVAGWLRVSKDAAGTWPCGVAGSRGCVRRIVEHGYDDLVAVCGDEPPRCAKVRVPRSAVGLRRLDLLAFAGALLGSAGLEGIRPTATGRAVVAGPVDLGARQVVIACTPEASILGLLDLGEQLRAAHRAARLLLLAPLAAPLRPPEALAFDRLTAEVLPLATVGQVVDGAVAGDLSAWVLRHADEFQGFDPLPALRRRRDLVLDPRRQRCAVWGRWVDLRRFRLPRLLLEGLAAAPGRMVTKDSLFDAVWPGKHPDDVEAWETNLRSHKSTLDRVLRPALGGRPSPIETVSGGTFDGGYRLMLEPDRVAWWTRPDA